jgi:dihydroorotate dehydrogenase (NAD+) catalytic subunit
MVWEATHATSIPVIGIGGIMNEKDAIEFLLAGATAIQVGTANFVNPKVTVEILNGIEGYLKRKKIYDIKKVIGRLCATESLDNLNN